MIQPNDSSQSSLLDTRGPAKAPLGRSPKGAAQATRKPRPGELSGVIAPHKSGKNFLLDTNVLLHDPGSIQRFADNHICLPVDVLSELDKFKNEQSERGANARAIHRTLTALFGHTECPVTEGVPTEGGGTLRLVIFDPKEAQKVGAVRQFHRVFPELDRVDHRILACALLVKEFNASPAILVTKDLNMQLKARAVGIRCQDYLNDKVEVKEVANYEYLRIPVLPNDLQRFASSGEMRWEGEGEQPEVALNQYVLLSAGDKKTMPARYLGEGRYVRLRVPEALRIPGGNNLKPVNLGQQCFVDAMLNPEISLVTCYGQAGTGKTLVGVAAGLSEVLARNFNGLTVSRPIVAMGEGVGFLPGSLDDKMKPWLQPIYDALDLLLRPDKPQAPRRKQKTASKEAGGNESDLSKPYDHLLQQGLIEIEALCYIRGRSIPNRFFILDEAQQLTPLEAKTVVTRISRGSKLVLIGDPAQIDNPYVDSRSNGLVYTRKRMKGQPFAAHVFLTKGERSALAEAGAQLM
ncbi:MAG: PhoH family protein [Verrucomicrobiota bacterium]